MIEKFSDLKAVAIPLDRMNVDTDAILPARFLKTIKRTGLGGNLFHAWRFDESGSEAPGFPLNVAAYRNGKILVTGENFGCGSSREHAVWALMDYGIRVVIAPSFSDIFYANGLKNGLLPVRLAAGDVRALIDLLLASPGGEISVDLQAQTVIGPDGASYTFEIGAFPKECLLKGLDEIAMILEREADISRYEREWKSKTPWLFADI
jgi:3-isopropylmalate/(R)-2-methylmalate dehydratase small subunit